jgi:hypothetical protein
VYVCVMARHNSGEGERGRGRESVRVWGREGGKVQGKVGVESRTQVPNIFLALPQDVTVTLLLLVFPAGGGSSRSLEREEDSGVGVKRGRYR